MASALIRFYAELNDYLPADKCGVSFVVEFGSGATIREILDATAVPLSQIDLILVNGDSVDVSSPLFGGERVAVYPVFESLDISRVQTVRERPLRDPSFVLDVHLGKLAYHLRMLGFDSLYRNDYRDSDLLMISTTEARILLSKDRRLLEEPALTRCYRVQQTNPRLQLIEVLRRFDLFESTHPFTRCLLCNTLLRVVAKGAVLHRLSERVRELFDEFQFCPFCDRVYWKGSHYERMEEFIREVLAAEKSGRGFEGPPPGSA